MSARMFGWFLFLCSAVCSATSQHEVFNNAIPFPTSALRNLKGLDQDKATLDNPAAARAFLNTIKSIQGGVADLPTMNGTHKDSYVLIHLLRWADQSNPAKPKIQSDHWYLYRDVAPGQWSQEDFTSAKRLLGVKQVYLLYVHFTDQTPAMISSSGAQYAPNYDLTITQKTPANVAHLYALLSAYTGGTTSQPSPSGTNKELALAAESFFVWGGGILNLQYRPSDILIKSTFTVSSDPAKTESDASSGGSSDNDPSLADDITFDNEGPYYWDVGFAVPVKKISELKLDTTSGTATPAKVNSVNVFSVFDFYFKPVDVKGSGFMAYPHPIAGVAFAKQPLHKILVGGAWGPKASEIYVGAMFVKQPNLSGNNSCSNLSGTSFTGGGHFCTQFTVGINLSVSAIASKLGAPK